MTRQSCDIKSSSRWLLAIIRVRPIIMFLFRSFPFCQQLGDSAVIFGPAALLPQHALVRGQAHLLS